MTEEILDNKHYRILTDAVNNIWDRISFWKKASDIEYDDGTTGEENKTSYAILKRNTRYEVGNIVRERSAKPYMLFECVTAGTTAGTLPIGYSSILDGEIDDGTVVFKVYATKIVSAGIYDGTTFSDEAKVGCVSVGVAKQLAAFLQENGAKFYFDYHNGVYGYNTSSDRGIDTFAPFNPEE